MWAASGRGTVIVAGRSMRSLAIMEGVEQVAAVALLLLGAVFAVAFSVGLAKSIRTRKWVAVPGVIKSSFLAKSRDYRDHTQLFLPTVTYRYDYRGRSMTGESIGVFSRPDRFEDRASAVLAKYPVGASVTVYVNPDNPRDCVLSNATEWGALLGVAAGLLFSIFAIYVLIGK